VSAFNRRELDTLCTLYAADAVLWGTLATELITEPAALRAYFERALGPALDTTVELLDVHRQAGGDGTQAVLSGRYRLRFRQGGVVREVLARYSLVLAGGQDGGWRIRHHHSSLMPEAPAATTAEPAAQALRQVSIVFMDLVGSTTLAQRLDPESVAQVMDGALARGTAIVQAHGGRVLQYAGDNILAAFGADAAHEDDAERAVLCGLALRVLGQELGREVAAAHGHAGFGVRVGIHTGGVLLGGGVDAEGSIRGVAVNIAARMEQTAPPGGLRISQDTWLQVRGLFEAEPQPPLAVKGVDEPVASWLVTGPRPRHQRSGTRGLEGVPTRMVGRGAELAQLQSAFERLCAGQRLAVLSVEAEAGVGKSRLRQEFEAWAESQPVRPLSFRGRATPATAAQPYGLLRDIVATRLHIADDDTLEAARRKLEAALVPLFVHDDGPELAEAHAHLLGHLVGIDARASRHLRGILDDPRQIRSRAFHAAAQWLRRLAAQQGLPLLLLLEDLHWADAESLEFLQHLVATGTDLPLLVLAFTRPPPEGALPWAAAAPEHGRIGLQPLDAGDSAALADELLQKLPDAPAALRELLTHKAEGNPFYMEELLRMLIAQGAVLTGEPWRVDAERLRITRVPATLTGVLQARLDGLAPPLRQALQQASIVGAVFWDRALAAVDERAPGQLPALVQRELTLPRADAPLEGLHEYAFRHQLLHQVTYDTVLRSPRLQGHARVARWLAALSDQGGLHAGDLLGLAAEHFERAGLAAPAAEYHARAAEHAGQRVAHARVLAHVERALALLGEADPADAAAANPAALRLQWRLRAVREHTLHLQSRRSEQGDELDRLDRLAEWLDDPALRADAARRRSLRAMRMADWPAMEQAGQRGAEQAAKAGDSSLRLQALRLVALAQVHQGRYDDGRALVAQALPEVRRLGLREVEARLLNVLAIAAEAQGRLVEALALDRQSLQAFAEVGDRVNEAISLANVGEGAMKLGALEAGERDLLAALQRVRANGDLVFEALVLGQLSTLARWRGDAALARQRAEAARALARHAQAPDTELVAQLRVADAALALGEATAAHEAYAQALALAQGLGHAMAHDAQAGLARAALARGAVAKALAALQPLLAHHAGGGEMDGAEYPRAIEWTLAEVLHTAGDPRAAAWLERAHAALLQQAAAIGDAALREAFLRDIPHHRAIVAAARGGAG
jgi:predicted ATPase/class 3 adenylate cyclase